LLGELHCSVDKATMVFCDNVSTVYMTRNPVHHKRTKHIELDIHFVREKVAIGEVCVAHIPHIPAAHGYFHQRIADGALHGLQAQPLHRRHRRRA
jgi:hypothetical protein